MALDEKDLERTLEATEKTLSTFAGIEAEFRRMMEAKEQFARDLGADNYEQVVAASQKGMSEEARAKLREAREALKQELEEDRRAAELKFQQEQSSQRGSGASRARRMGRMI